MLLLITVCGWMPQILHYIIPDSVVLSPSAAYTICTVCIFYYPIAITIFFKEIAPRIRDKYGKGKTLRIWEVYVSIAWQIQTVGFTCLTMTTTPYLEHFTSIPSEATKYIGLSLVALGIASKGSAIYMTGYNTYYWYDMVLNTPNAYFVVGGIYRFCGSPTYTLGRFTGFGAAIHLRSVPLFVASFVDLVLITLFNCVVEQPFVKIMYS